MAHHNIVHLYGALSKDPSVKIDKETGEVVKAVMFLDTIRSSRPYRNMNEKEQYEFDQVLIMSGDPEIVHKMKELKANDIVQIKGTITTRNVKKKMTCPECGKIFALNENTGKDISENSMITFITPICVNVIMTELTGDEARDELVENREFSNEAMVIGRLCKDPVQHKSAKGKTVAIYQLGINRKYFVSDDDPENSADYPWVRVKSDQMKVDLKCLHQNSMVLIDGFISLRKFKRKVYCPYCDPSRENGILISDNTLDIVPYTVEYLQDYTSLAEIEAMEDEKAEAARKELGLG